MIYFIYGCNQELLIKQEVKKIIKEEIGEVNDFNCINYDLDTVDIESIFNDALTLPFLDDKKAIIVKNFNIFSSLKYDIDENIILDYFKNPSPSTVLILTSIFNLDEKKNLTKELKKVARLIKINDVEKKDWNEVIGRLLNQYKIDITNDAKTEFINRVSGDLNNVINEINKLKNLNTTITIDIINKLVSRPLEDNMFGIVDALLNDDPNTALSIYYDLKQNGEDSVRLVSALASQFRFLYQVRYLKDKNFSNDEIAKRMNNIKSGRIYYAIKKLGTHSANDILKIIDELADLDFDIRMNGLDKDRAFELFLISKH